MSSSRTDIVRVPVPAGVGAGQLVGRGGHNTKWLHIHSGGAHITVNDLDVIIRAKDTQVRMRAVQLVQRQLDAMLRFGTHETLAPCRLDYVLLESAFGHDPRVRFAARNDEVAAAAHKRDKLFDLVPVSRAGSGSSSWGGVQGDTQHAGGNSQNDRASSEGGPPLLAEVDCWIVAAAGAPKGLRCAVPPVRGKAPNDVEAPPSPPDHVCSRDQDPAPGPASPAYEGSAASTLRFHAATSRTSTAGFDLPAPLAAGASSQHQLLAPAARTLAVAARSAAAVAAVSGELGLDVLKIRFHLGKHLFRNVGVRGTRPELAISDLEGAGAGRGAYQSVFSNFVPASAVPRLTSWLTGSLGFALVDTKTTATLHVINQELNVHYSIALTMDRGDDSTSALRKVKAGGSRFHSVALMAAPNQLDLRLKLEAQSTHREQPGPAYDADAHTTARRVAAAVRTEGFDGFTRSKRGLPRNRHLEYARRKTKYVYEGVVPAGGEGGCGQRLRVSVTQVQDDKGTHYEVSGCLPEVDARMLGMLASAQQQVQQQQATAACVSGRYVPEWRRGRSSGGETGHVGTGAAAAARRLHDSANSSPARTPSPRVSASASTVVLPTPAELETDLPWAAGVLVCLSDFVNQLNEHLGGLEAQ